MEEHAGSFEVIVCGAGHAGTEAALAAARLGARTLLLTGNLDTVGQMSCNPAIGGQAKGQMVREVDALGGEMAINTDTTAIQFRLLNESKGEAVQSPRAQCDKKAYQFRLKHTLEHQPGLLLFQATVTGLVLTDSSHPEVTGVETSLGLRFRGRSVVVTTGTFLRALMHVGQSTTEGGRMGDFSARHLSQSLVAAGIELRRLKTGTPPRILGRSIDFSRLARQDGDSDPCLFAFHDTRPPGDLFHVEHSDEVRPGWPPGSVRLPCWLTHTSPDSEKLVRDNLHRSALYAGRIEGVGPRYCPSIEDKFVRFADKARHQLYLEPEGRGTNEYYINGLSTSLPFDVQTRLVQTIPGLEHAHLVRPAYAVEYDFAPPTQLQPSLESRLVSGLFFAGQINGTSGYEEAGAQGLVAGVNAAGRVLGLEPLILQRHEAYIGVLIDDLVTRGTNEPYRMFTSRAEHRLLLNHGSAEIRLLPHLRKYGLVPLARREAIAHKAAAVERWCAELEGGPGAPPNGTWAAAVRRGQNPALPPAFQAETPAVRAEVLYRVRYRGYLEREHRDVARWAGLREQPIPTGFDFQSLRGLRRESADKLAALRPENLAAAQRISGVSPADLHVLAAALDRRPPSRPASSLASG